MRAQLYIVQPTTSVRLFPMNNKCNGWDHHHRREIRWLHCGQKANKHGTARITNNNKCQTV